MVRFVFVHPSSTFADDPAAACPPGSLLCYASLLETTQPYLLNLMPMSALHTLLLFGRRLDTDVSCTRVVVDAWLELHIDDPKAGQQLLLIAHQLRLLLQHTMTARLARRLSRLATESRGLAAPGLTGAAAESEADPPTPPLPPKVLATLPDFAQQIHAR